MKQEKPLKIRYRCLQYVTEDGESIFKKEREGNKRRQDGKAKTNKRKKNPQTWLTELIDGDELEGAGKQLLKKSAANNLPWVRCVKSISTASKAATVIGIPY